MSSFVTIVTVVIVDTVVIVNAVVIVIVIVVQVVIAVNCEVVSFVVKVIVIAVVVVVVVVVMVLANGPKGSKALRFKFQLKSSILSLEVQISASRPKFWLIFQI